MPFLEQVEEFSLWFQNQEAANRLEILTSLLEMLHPLELRFIGSCVEELTRKDYNCLRDYEIRSNTEQIAGELIDMTNPCCRSKLLVALSLLYSGNYCTADVLYKALLSLNAVFHKLPNTKEVLDEVLLLLNMAKHHPAFKFDQRAAIAELEENILRFSKRRDTCKIAAPPFIDSPPSPPSANACSLLPNTTDVIDDPVIVDGRRVHDSTSAVEDDLKMTIDCGSQTDDEFSDSVAKAPSTSQLLIADNHVSKEVEENCAPAAVSSELFWTPPPFPDGCARVVENFTLVGFKNADNGNCVFELMVRWSNGDEDLVEKSFDDLHDFHSQLLVTYPVDAGVYCSKRKLPYFPGFGDSVVGDHKENLSVQMDMYIRQLNLSSTILRSDLAANFLKTPTVLPALPLSGRLANSFFMKPADVINAKNFSLNDDSLLFLVTF